jgi:hypothetical protein
MAAISWRIAITSDRTVACSRLGSQRRTATRRGKALSLARVRRAAGSISMLLSRQYTANAATRIRHITRVPGNQMHVHMHSRLATSLADIHADVVAIGRVLRLA